MAGDLGKLRAVIREAILADEDAAVARLVERSGLDAWARTEIAQKAMRLVEQVRKRPSAGMLEGFLAEYSLSTNEGIALMCLAEALLRVPDTETMDALIEDKIVPSKWIEHLNRANSPLVNVSTLALTLTGEVLRDSGEGISRMVRDFVQRIGEPVIRGAVMQAMKILGGQFVLGRDIEEAVAVARRTEKAGFTHSYDMLGEAARTEADAKRYRNAYAEAIATLAARSTAPAVRDNPGVSVKLSALHPRYEFAQRQRVMDELVERVLALAVMARGANMGFNIDAEEQDRLDLSLDVIEAVLSDERLAGWDGFGVVVQAYGPRAAPVIDWLTALAEKLDRRIMVRLVKGAYWDSEIKRAQVMGLDGFPVFTRKASTDVSYIANARMLLERRDRIYPQFATHNAHSKAAILHLVETLGVDKDAFEFQRLHGMGERLHELVAESQGTRTRIYAPVGRHSDLLAYLVRRLLENGANGSFVNMLADRDVPAAEVVRDPFARALKPELTRGVVPPPKLFGPQRTNSRGWDLTDPLVVAALLREREAFAGHHWVAGPILAGEPEGGEVRPVLNPADGSDVGAVVDASAGDLDMALATASAFAPRWAGTPVKERAAILRRASEALEANSVELFAILAREAGKGLPDCVGEVREAVDFMRYYAAEAEAGPARVPLGVVGCISPWNFPLSIFVGQISAALVAGNAVVAKPAETTPLIAAKAVSLLHEAGVPREVLQLLPGEGRVIGAGLSADPRVDGMCFTGSLPTAQAIDRAMAEHLSPVAPLIAETGGINAMIVDSTALPEQAVRDILSSAFQSAGQRCSALRLLYLQEDTAEKVIEMLTGAMDELRVGDPWQLETDIGPVIDAAARDRIDAHVEKFAAAGKVIKRLDVPASGTFVGPVVIRVAGIEEVEKEVFGPVLHVATFKASALEQVVKAINDSGYGLTFGLHTRIDARVRELSGAVHAGNIYVNRNQIGAVVGSQPFGGENLSGTGPKAGGPFYLPRFSQPAGPRPVRTMPNAMSGVTIGTVISAADKIRGAFIADRERKETLLTMPGPTGESNVLHVLPRGLVLCMGPDEASAEAQARMALAHGNAVLIIAPGAQRIADELGQDGAIIGGMDRRVSHAVIEAGLAVDAVCYFADDEVLRPIRLALSKRDGAIIPLIAAEGEADRLQVERHVCIDTTASGGNAELLSRGGL